jgi:hypothetical protein
MGKHLAALLAGNVKIGHDDQVERGRPGLPLHDVSLDPGHLDAPIGCQSPRFVQTNGGKVDAGDKPALRGEPH